MRLSTQPPFYRRANFVQNQSNFVEYLVSRLRSELQGRSGQGIRRVAPRITPARFQYWRPAQFYLRRTVKRPNSEFAQRRFLNTRSAVRSQCADNRRCIFRLCPKSSCNKFFCMGNPRYTCASRGICLGQSVQCHHPHVCKSSQRGTKRRRLDSSSVRTNEVNTS